MRHAKRTLKLGRKSQHRDAMLANLVCSLIQHNRIKTTLAKAKAVRPLAEKMVTLGKKGALHHRRQAASTIKQPQAVKKLFAEVAPRFKERNGGYTRIYKLGPRNSDAAEMALVEWIGDAVPTAEEPVAAKSVGKAVKAEKSPKPKKKSAKKEESKKK